MVASRKNPTGTFAFFIISLFFFFFLKFLFEQAGLASPCKLALIH